MPSCEVFRVTWTCKMHHNASGFESETFHFVSELWKNCLRRAFTEFEIMAVQCQVQPDSYKSELLPADVPKMSVEVC